MIPFDELYRKVDALYNRVGADQSAIDTVTSALEDIERISWEEREETQRWLLTRMRDAACEAWQRQETGTLADYLCRRLAYILSEYCQPIDNATTM